MKRGPVILGVGVGVVVIAVAVVAGPRLYGGAHRYLAEQLDDTDTHEADGRSFGAHTTERGCLAEALVRVRSPLDMEARSASQWFVSGCLGMASVDGLCDGVPPVDDGSWSPVWRAELCRPYERATDAYCLVTIARQVERHCEEQRARANETPAERQAREERDERWARRAQRKRGDVPTSSSSGPDPALLVPPPPLPPPLNAPPAGAGPR